MGGVSLAQASTAGETGTRTGVGETGTRTGPGEIHTEVIVMTGMAAAEL